VHVRIDRLEVRPPPRAQPRRAPAPPQPPRGFAEFALARRFLDRGWS
jgi:hypothetical protein